MQKEQLTRLGVVLSILLFGGKLHAGLRADSTAVLSDALNSLLDVFSYTAIHISVMLQEKAPDANHPFGHRRAEPLAGFIIAIFAAILGATIIKEAGFGFFEAHHANRDPLALIVMSISIVMKVGMGFAYHIAWSKSQSMALRASFVDSCNDALASLVALVGLILGRFWDDIAGLLIGGWILFSGIRVGLEAIGYLMGKVPTEEMMEKIREATMEIPGVSAFNDLRAHFVGDRIHVEIHIEVDDTLSLRKAHDVSMAVRYRLQDLREINRAFIHIDPVTLWLDPVPLRDKM
ncbi:MAG: cation diffusion facilitator family transporter [Candidatus Poribacteria bacterium]|nr:cation diffusion facilitator family transporter [Candidatus Poribacteria bacterium]